MRRTWLYCAVVALVPIVALVAWRANTAQADKSVPSAPLLAKKLPISQIVLFNTGLGYFQREGDVEGDARIELSIPTGDINDVLKTLLIDNGDKPVSISYEGAEPIETKLKAFQLDLATNPSLGDLLNQARGEKVELTVEATGGGAAAAVTGGIVGMEAHFENQHRELHYLNVICADGVRRVPLERIQRVRFLDPVVEEEFRRALSVLSAGRADLRRLVSVQFNGEGRRKVRLGHVAETPLWKATYRLVLGKAAKSSLQGWAIVENNTDEDWRDVRIVLVSGRPITFQMDLSQQLFMPRPKVEPEVFASLRPPTLAPALQGQEEGGGQQVPRFNLQQNQLNFNTGGNQLGGGQVGNTARFQSGIWTPGRPAVDASQPTFGPGGKFSRYQSPPGSLSRPRLTYEDLQQRRSEMLARREADAARAKSLGSSLADLGAGIDDIVTNADRIGEGFRYSVEPRVTLQRQKSGLLSVINSDIELTRLSIYNPSVHPRFPLRGMKVKNTSGTHMQQGPIAVYDNGDYVGDCRLPDMQPDQERLLTYAMDLGVEVRPDAPVESSKVMGVEARDGKLHIQTNNTRSSTYKMLNRSKEERLVAVEHFAGPWKLAKDGEKPAETTRQTHRFQWNVAPGKTESRTVSEIRTESRIVGLQQASDGELEQLAHEDATPAAVKTAIRTVQDIRKKIAEAQTQIKKAEGELKPMQQEQERLIAALPRLPSGSSAHKRTLERYDAQEAEIEKIQKSLAKMRSDDEKTRAEYETMSRTLTVK